MIYVYVLHLDGVMRHWWGTGENELLLNWWRFEKEKKNRSSNSISLDKKNDLILISIRMKKEEEESIGVYEWDTRSFTESPFADYILNEMKEAKIKRWLFMGFGFCVCRLPVNFVADDFDLFMAHWTLYRANPPTDNFNIGICSFRSSGYASIY